MRQITFYLLFILILLFIIISNLNKTDASKLPLKNKEQVQYSLWLVDWKYKQSLEETKKVNDQLTNIQLFTTYFNSTNDLYQTNESKKLIESTFSNTDFNNNHIYLTIINDQFVTETKVNQKSTTLLENLLSTSEARKNHINQIVALAKQYPFDGVEIDYEKISTELIPSYNSFLQELNSALKTENLSLRVVLESRFPIEKQYENLPSDAQYIIMAYNLYGYHSGPGPKVDYPFLDKLVTRINKTKLDINIALATGGFSWKNGIANQVTEQDVENILQQYNPQQFREPKSDVLHFTYSDHENNLVEVWYADDTTLDSWIKYLNSKNINKISLWRSGGLSENTLNMISNK